MLALMGIYRLIGVLRQLDPETGAYSDMFSGMYVGVNCGAVAGGLLAGEIGTRAVFLIAGGVLAFALVQVLLVMPGLATGKPAAPAPRPAAVSPLAMSDLPTLAFLLLVSVPTSACSMFLIYYFPVYASGLGQPPATIGHAFLLYGLCIVYLGPVLSRWMRTTTLAPRWPVVLSGLVMAAGLTTFALTDSLWSAFLAILLLGLSDCIGLPAQQHYLEGLPVVARHGLAVPQSYHLNARKAGQIVGPMLFSAAALTGGEGIALLSSGLAVGLLFFLIQSLRMARSRLAVSDVS
jgi:predicted MFS family arabinose efflux permease